MVPPCSHRVSRVRRYFGYSWFGSLFAYRTLTFYGLLSHTILLNSPIPYTVRTPGIFLLPVWPAPRSLATTYGISVDVFSSPYLDVSVQAVPYTELFYSPSVDTVLPCRVSPFGNPRIIGYLLLPVAYRSLSRPSSAPDAKAFPLRSFLLDLFAVLFYNSLVLFENYASFQKFFEIV